MSHQRREERQFEEVKAHLILFPSVCSVLRGTILKRMKIEERGYVLAYELLE